MKLEDLSQKVKDSFGLLHQSNLAVLRQYINNTSEEQLTKEINDIKQTVLLRTLWEAGLSSALQQVVLAKLKEVS